MPKVHAAIVPLNIEANAVSGMTMMVTLDSIQKSEGVLEHLLLNPEKSPSLAPPSWRRISARLSDEHFEGEGTEGKVRSK